MQIKQKFCKDM